MELERLLSSQGFGTRRYCRGLVLSGRVMVGERIALEPEEELETKGLEFSVDGEVWQYRENAYLMLNKPAGYECSQKPTFHPSVYRLLPKQLLDRGVQSVGRLDEDTTGLLLFSDDGKFIHTYTSPNKKVVKVYEAEVKHGVSADQIDRLLSGVKLNDEVSLIKAAACEMSGDRTLILSVTEGKYHLVKRMIAAAGNRVIRLKRICIGALVLPTDLGDGEWKWLDEADLGALATRVE